MLSYAIFVSTAMVVVAMFLTLIRLIRGPSLPDRVLALDTLTINAIGVVILFGMSLASSIYFEAALLMAMMGFVGTAAICKFMLSGDVIE